MALTLYTLHVNITNDSTFCVQLYFLQIIHNTSLRLPYYLVLWNYAFTYLTVIYLHLAEHLPAELSNCIDLTEHLPVEFYWPVKCAYLKTLNLNMRSNFGNVRPVYEN